MSRYLFHTVNGELLLPVEGLSIARCVIDHAFSLEAFRDNDVVTLRIEGSFIVIENGVRHVLDSNEPAKLGPAIALVRAVVRRARASAAGRLGIVFDGGREAIIEPNEDFEAWEFIGPRGAKAVCSAGGGVSTWGGGYIQPDDEVRRDGF